MNPVVWIQNIEKKNNKSAVLPEILYVKKVKFWHNEMNEDVKEIKIVYSIAMNKMK